MAYAPPKANTTSKRLTDKGTLQAACGAGKSSLSKAMVTKETNAAYTNVLICARSVYRQIEDLAPDTVSAANCSSTTKGIWIRKFLTSAGGTLKSKRSR